ncbi:MAG TPA: hypothetical protein VIB79_08645 [Candidatus Binatia bacterium]|jgi:ABC-type transporter Mla MlaB component
MLRITTRVDGTGTILDLEGKLAGPWVEELENCWKQIGVESQPLRVSLKSVTFIDSAGTTLLDKMHRKGVELQAEGCMIKAIVAEIRRGKSK